MKRIYVNEEWCLGCHLCEYNCAFANTASAGKSKANEMAVSYTHLTLPTTPYV